MFVFKVSELVGHVIFLKFKCKLMKAVCHNFQNCLEVTGFLQYVKCIQWNPVNTDTKGTCHSVRITNPGGCIKRTLRENVRNTCFIDIKTKVDSFTRKRCLIP